VTERRQTLRLSGREAESTDDDMARFIVGAPSSAKVKRTKTGYRDFATGEDVDFTVTWNEEAAVPSSPMTDDKRAPVVFVKVGPDQPPLKRHPAVVGIHFAENDDGKQPPALELAGPTVVPYDVAGVTWYQAYGLGVMLSRETEEEAIAAWREVVRESTDAVVERLRSGRV
jgi:hypothetical protein